MTGLRIWEQMNIPNTVSLIRAVSIFGITWWWQPNEVGTVLAIAFIGLTDALDGMLARGLKQNTPLGVQLDPLADKIFLLGSFWHLVSLEQHKMLWALFGIMLLYDLFNTAARRKAIWLALRNEYYEVAKLEQDRGVSLLSKTKTAYLFVLLALMVPDATMPFLTISTEVILGIQQGAILLGIAFLVICLGVNLRKTSTRGRRNRMRGITNAQR